MPVTKLCYDAAYSLFLARQMNQEATPPRIQSIKVNGLFGLYDHHVMLNDERVTVMHGPNGVGKTVLLKLIDAFLHGNYLNMLEVPFDRFEVSLVDGSVAGVRCERFKGVMGNEWLLSLNFTASGEHPQSDQFGGLESDIESPHNDLLKHISHELQIGSSEWWEARRYAPIEDTRLAAAVARNWAAHEPKGLRTLRGQINVHLIEAQRLIRLPDFSNNSEPRISSQKKATNTVQEYSNELKHRLEAVLADYAKQSQKLDQSFPQRLIQHVGTSATREQLKSSMARIEETRSRLKKLGILDSGDAAQEAYPLEIAQFDALQAEQVAVMAVYAHDTTQKLAVLEELAGRVEILLGVLNRKFTNKQVSLSREEGLSIKGRDGKPIPVNALSSGEQHELVLLYDLLFKVKPNTLVLIDEPELSLHISWQKSFMDDLLAIIRLAQFDVLMATHSPYIVGDHSDLLVELSSDVATNDVDA